MNFLTTWLAVAALLGAPARVREQQQQPPAPTVAEPPQTPQTQTPPLPTLDTTIAAGEAETEEPARKLVRWNEFDGKYLTFRFGGGFLYDVANYSQDNNSTQQ